MPFVDDVQKREAEEMARDCVCEACPFSDKCDGHEYTPVCLWSGAETLYNQLMQKAEEIME